MTSKDSDEPIHPPSMARILIKIFYPSLDSPEAVEGTCNQKRLWSDCTYVQADLSLRWLHKSNCRFCHALVQIKFERPFYHLLMGLKSTRWVANSADPWQMPHSVASDLGLHCLLRTVNPNTKGTGKYSGKNLWQWFGDQLPFQHYLSHIEPMQEW